MNGITELQVLRIIASYGHSVTIGNVFAAFPNASPGPERNHIVSCVKALETAGFIRLESEHPTDTWVVTDKGHAHLASVMSDAQREEQSKNLSFRKLQAETVIAEWMRRTYKWTFWMAIIGTVTGIAGICLSLWTLLRK